MNKRDQRIPRERFPLITIGVLNADASNLGARLLEIAAQDYAGPTEVFVVMRSNHSAFERVLLEFPWAFPLFLKSNEASEIKALVCESTGKFIALLPRTAHPHSLWVDELVAVAVQNDLYAAVAPVLTRSSGEIVAIGASLGKDQSWIGGPQSLLTNGTETDIDAAFGDGILIRRKVLEDLSDFDDGLDLRAWGVGFSLQVRSKGMRIVAAPRARVTVARSNGVAQKPFVSLTPESELRLIARHNPEFLPRALTSFGELDKGDDKERERVLKESIHRAGIDISEKAVELFSRVLREAARLKLKSNDEINELIQKVGSLERSNHETAIVMHREMAWAHTLNEKLANSEQLLEAERQRLTTEIERTQSQLSAEKDRLEREIGEVVHQLEVAKQRVEILEKGQQGSEFKEIIIRDIERRWREAEDRRETAIRELGSAVERVRGLEEARTSFEARMRDEQLKFERIDKELQELRDKSSRIELDNRQLHLTVERDSAEKNELIKRIKNAEDAFDAASKSLRNYELDIEKLRLQMAEAESRRESSERLLVETQISLEGSKRALNELTSELGQERRKRSDEVLKTVKEVEKATQLIAQLEDQVSALSERILSAESYAADLQVKLTHETSRADASEAREEALRISLSQSREAIAGYEKQVSVLQRERESLRESIQRYQENVNELESSLELLRSDLARIESIVKDLQAERLQLLDTIQSNEKAIADLKVQISVRETEFLDRMDEFRKERTSYQSKIEKLQLELNTERERHAIERAAHEASREKIRILEAARSALSAEAAALKNANAALHTEIGELQSTGRQLRERIEELIVERNELQQLLTTERGYAHLLHLQKSKVEQDLASTRAQLEATLFTLDAAYRDLDASRSVHAERVLDLARLRSSTKLDRDMLILQIVNLLSEVKRARLWGRKWTVAEREFLAGPGAGFVNEPLR